MLCSHIIPNTRKCNIGILILLFSPLCRYYLSVNPENPTIHTIDVDGRIKIARGSIPQWMIGETVCYCVPLYWRRAVDLPVGHELEAWLVWNAALESEDWLIKPKNLLLSVSADPGEQTLRSLMFEVRCDSRDRLSCAGLFSSIAKIAGRYVWIAPGEDTISIWSNFAFQAQHGRAIGSQ
jgi:hypothetical protein